MHYTPPTPGDLRLFKEHLGFTGEQMAELFGLAGGQQWRKYTGGAEPREMGAQMLFFAAARLELEPEALERVLQLMRDIGAGVDIPPAPPPALHGALPLDLETAVRVARARLAGTPEAAKAFEALRERGWLPPAIVAAVVEDREQDPGLTTGGRHRSPVEGWARTVAAVDDWLADWRQS